MKEGLGDTLEKVQAALKDPGTPPEDKARIDKVLTQMTSTLRTIQDPGTTPEEKAQLTTIVAGMTEALRIALDEEAPATSKWYSMRASDMADTMKGLEAPGLPPETRALTLAHLESASAGLMALHAPQSEPEKPQDAKRVREVLEENFASVKSLQSPDSKERNRAKGKLDRLHGSLTDPEHRRFVEELKRLKAPAACLTSVENRTREVGWADGSLWGVTEQSCADTVSAGAADTSSDWSPLFRCLEQKPFSQCTGTVPKE
ncbi:hypothetical protein ACIRD2_31445 [Streptomyces sp. NPDC093595]|uniref:hypothetical protein n=1 Tax=Streptomyces sp. NPDC093595 TaxID=3366045 RepID=UPI003807B07D